MQFNVNIPLIWMFLVNATISKNGFVVDDVDKHFERIFVNVLL